MIVRGTCHCGQCSWVLSAEPEAALRCNCTVCRRYGALWVYGYEGRDVSTEGVTVVYQPGESLGFYFCANCHGLMFWRALAPNGQGLFRVGLNLRMSKPERVGPLCLDYFDGLEHWVRHTNTGQIVEDVL